MKKIILFDTSQGTQNLGDYIIRDSINKEMNELLCKSFVTRYSTHTPISRWYQLIKPGYILDECKNANFKLLCGTNLFKKSLVRINSDWNIGLSSIPYYKGAIAMGCGMEHNSKVFDIYTKFIYKNILSKKYIHSTRDQKTKEFLDKLGVKSINTGCPTTWMLSKTHCEKMPTQKSDKVIFTLTDYKKDEFNDQILIDILNKNYKEVYFWIQGSKDLEYFNNMKNIENIKLINANLEDFREQLLKGNVDYVGTRLHAGIYAMKYFVRSIILIVDNRARDMKETYNLVAIERNKINDLEYVINSDFKTEININEKGINEWKSQFLY